MPPVMTDYTFAFGDTGFVLNTDSIGLPFIDIDKVSGLDTAPIRSTVNERQGQDGTYIHTKYQSSRAIIINGTLYTDSADPDSLLDRLRSDYALDSIRPFYFQTPGRPLRYINAQGGGLVYDVDTARRQGLTLVQFTLLAADPYIYDYPAQTAVVSVPTIVAIGTGFNMAFNVGFGGAIPLNGATVGNAGTHTAYPTITIQGPVTNPVLTDGFGVTMAFAITLAATDYLVVDCRSKSIVLNGQASRRNTMAGLRWFSVPAGASETIFFSADSGTGSATITMSSTYY